jgi:hypothetical protein
MSERTIALPLSYDRLNRNQSERIEPMLSIPSPTVKASLCRSRRSQITLPVHPHAAKWRVAGYGPAHYKIGRNVRYRLNELLRGSTAVAVVTSQGEGQ